MNLDNQNGRKKRKYTDEMQLKHYFCINFFKGVGRKAENYRPKEAWYQKD